MRRVSLTRFASLAGARFADAFLATGMARLSVVKSHIEVHGGVGIAKCLRCRGTC